jgi:hypothetical protein
MCSNPQTKKLRWIVRRGAFGGAGHVGPDCRDGGAFVCCHGGAFHDGRRGSLLFLRLFGELDHDALQNEGSRVKQDGMITRFGLFFGGLVTAIAGVIAKQFGAAVGGLFLAFPAIFPASATLIEETREAKEGKKGLHGAPRGREAASMDAGGAAMGSIGLLLFALSCLALYPEPQSVGGTEDCHARWARSFCDEVDESKTSLACGMRVQRRPTANSLRLWHFHSREAFAGFQKHLLTVGIAGGRIRFPGLHMVKVIARNLGGRIIADRQPNLSSVASIQIVRRSGTSHPGRYPAWLERVGENVGPTTCDRKGEQHIMQFRVGVRLHPLPLAILPVEILQARITTLVQA